MSFYFFYFIEFNIFRKFFFFASSFIAESQVESNLSCVMRIFSKALASVLKHWQCNFRLILVSSPDIEVAVLQELSLSSEEDVDRLPAG